MIFYGANVLPIVASLTVNGEMTESCEDWKKVVCYFWLDLGCLAVRI